MNKRKPTQKTAPIDVSQLQLLAIPEVAQLLSIGRTSVYDLINAKELETVKVGRSARVRVLVVSVKQYIERQRV